MIPNRRRQRGMLFIVTVAVMALVAGLLTMMTAYSVRFYRQRQADRVRGVARSIADSAAAYVRAQDWAGPTSPEPVALDVQAIVPPPLKGSATLTFLTRDGRRLCRIRAHVTLGVVGRIDEIDIVLPGP